MTGTTIHGFLYYKALHKMNDASNLEAELWYLCFLSYI